MMNDDSLKNNFICDEMYEKIIDATEKLVTSNGARNITVRDILKRLGITNRVFYNRFKNLDSVLQIVYTKTILKIREALNVDYESKESFFENVMDITTKVLLNSYDIKMGFNRYAFEHDSLSQNNYEWWIEQIKSIIEYAKEKDYVKDADSDALSYSIWCFCRGFNADAVERNIPREEAVRRFRYSFGIMLEGLKK